MDTKNTIAKFIEETRITDANLDKCFQEQSSLRAYYGACSAQADLKYNRLKLQFDVQEAALYKEVRERFTAMNVKSTEKMIENEVKVDPRWQDLKGKVLDAECEADVLKNLVMSLNDRRDMLIQCGADRRDETKGQLRAMEILKGRDATRLNILNQQQPQ